MLLLLPLLGCVTARRWVVVHLADGGTSRPIMVDPLGHEHPDQAMPEALALNAPPPGTQEEDAGSAGNHLDAHEGGGQNDNKVDDNNHAWEGETGMSQDSDEEIINDAIQLNLTSTSNTLTTTSISTSTTTLTSTTSTSTSTSTTTSTSTKIAITTANQPENTQTTTNTQQPLQPCHLSCLEALNSTHLTSNNTLTLSAGSSLTLECHMPLVPELILEDMLWLFHPGGTPEGQCSLTPNKYLNSCAGFPSISETDDRNETFLRQTLTFSDLETNHTGDYMCQVQVTCCPGQQQHLMSQQHKVKVSVKIWWADYTTELAVTGVVAAVLLLSLLGVSAYGWRQRSNNYYPTVEVEAPAIHHLPFIDDQDTDSFDSNISNERHETEAMLTQ